MRNSDWFWNQQALLYRLRQSATEMDWQRFELFFKKKIQTFFKNNVPYFVILGFKDVILFNPKIVSSQEK